MYCSCSLSSLGVRTAKARLEEGKDALSSSRKPGTNLTSNEEMKRRVEANNGGCFLRISQNFHKADETLFQIPVLASVAVTKTDFSFP